jgi:hypothetical protein
MKYQIINPRIKHFRQVINKIGTSKTEEDVVNMVQLDYGRMTLENNELFIYDQETGDLKLSLFLPKLSRNPKTGAEDGMKHILLGEGSASGKHLLRIRYHTGNWIFIQLKGGKSKAKTDFLIQEFRKAKAQRIETFGLLMGKPDEFEELRFHMHENYEKIRIQYTKPRVFGLEKLPYQKYYAWMKYEKESKIRRKVKETVVKRKRSLDYFNDSLFEKFNTENHLDPYANFQILDEFHSELPVDDKSIVPLLQPDLSGTCAFVGVLPEPSEDLEEIKPKMDESMDVFDIYNPDKKSHKTLNLPKLTLGLKPRKIHQHETGNNF